jgi:hypothetical protein
MTQPNTSSQAGVSYRPNMISNTVGLLFGSVGRSDTGPHHSEVDAYVLHQARQVFTSPVEWHSTAASYFATVAKRLPIVSQARFMGRLNLPVTSVPADFVLLCLSMRLLLQFPPEHAQSMQSSLYLALKGMTSLLEATDYSSLEFCQARLLVVLFEIGHGISAASVSIAACARAFRGLGLHKQWSNVASDQSPTLEQEERRRVCWAVFNMDRYGAISPSYQAN